MKRSCAYNKLGKLSHSLKHETLNNEHKMLCTYLHKTFVPDY